MFFIHTRLSCLATPKRSLLNDFKRCLQYIPIETDNKIEISHKMTRVIEMKRIAYARDKLSKNHVDKSPENMIIKCSSPQMNHYKGMRYDADQIDRHLASLGWRSRQSKDKYFIINPLGSHPGFEKDPQIKTFAELNLNPVLVNTLESKFKITKPSQVQAKSINKLLKSDKHQLLIAETGCGKTLSYVLPIIETVLSMKNTKRSHNEPLSLIIVPNRELAYQLYEVFTKFLKVDPSVDFRVVLDLDKRIINLKENRDEIDCNLYDSEKPPADIVISIPSRLKNGFARKRDYISPVHLKKLVVDEANLLLDDSNSPYIVRILNSLNLNFSSDVSRASAIGEDGTLGTQMVFVSATMPRDMKSILQDFLNFNDDLNVINTGNVNKVMMHVPQTFMRLNGVLKVQKLQELVLSDVKKSNSVMIFSNTAATATFVSKFLNENNINCELFHSSMDDESREMAISNFLNGTRKVISCTDMASRGLDTVHVKHVINFDTPKFIADYVHRLGRVGRLGSPVKGAHVTTFVSKAYEVETVWNIERSVRLATDLQNLNANITRILEFSYQPRYMDKKHKDVDKRNEQEN